MKRRRVTALGILLVLALTSLSFKCGGGNNNAQLTDPARRAAQAADDVAQALKAMTEAKRELLRNNRITREESNSLTRLLLKVEAADRTFLNRVKELRDINATDKPSLLTLFDSIVRSVDELDQSGVVSLGNADAKSRLSAIITTIRAALEIIKGLLQ